LQSVRFDPDAARSIAAFSIRQVGWFVLFFTLAAGVMALILSGAFAGKRAAWGAICLGLVLAADLGRAVWPWRHIWDYADKYATNPIVDELRDRPYEHRVADMPREFLEPEFQQASGKRDRNASTDYSFYQLYTREWAQHLFCYYNIQSLDIVQLPRKPEDLRAFEAVLTADTNAVDSDLFLRRWQLTNTRYILGTKNFYQYFNRQLDPVQHRLRVVTPFELVPKPGAAATGRPLTTEDIVAVPSSRGVFAFFEFTGALPRARLYSRWQVTTNDPAALNELRPGLGAMLTELHVSPSDQAALSRLADPAFDPEQCVLVDEDLPVADPPAGAASDAGLIEFVNYTPKDIRLKAMAMTPSVLLLNDRFDPDWHVQVDNEPAKLLRCNYLMRGVYLLPGEHRVEFRFQPPIRMFYLSLAALGLGFVLLALVAASSFRSWASAPASAAVPGPQGSRARGPRRQP
jgi:hypothetical protein